jgi:hypothetical protein
MGSAVIVLLAIFERICYPKGCGRALEETHTEAQKAATQGMSIVPRGGEHECSWYGVG